MLSKTPIYGKKHPLWFTIASSKLIYCCLRMSQTRRALEILMWMCNIRGTPRDMAAHGSKAKYFFLGFLQGTPWNPQEVFESGYINLIKPSWSPDVCIHSIHIRTIGLSEFNRGTPHDLGYTHSLVGGRQRRECMPFMSWIDEFSIVFHSFPLHSLIGHFHLQRLITGGYLPLVVGCKKKQAIATPRIAHPQPPTHFRDMWRLSGDISMSHAQDSGFSMVCIPVVVWKLICLYTKYRHIYRIWRRTFCRHVYILEMAPQSER